MNVAKKTISTFFVFAFFQYQSSYSAEKIGEFVNSNIPSFVLGGFIGSKISLLLYEKLLKQEEKLQNAQPAEQDTIRKEISRTKKLLFAVLFPSVTSLIIATISLLPHAHSIPHF